MSDPVTAINRRIPIVEIHLNISLKPLLDTLSKISHLKLARRV